MPTIITATQLRSTLGVSSSLYSDAVLNDIIDTTEQVVLPLLQHYSTPIVKVSLTSNVATFTTQAKHNFAIGDTVIITGVKNPFNGTVVVTEITDYTFTASITHANVTESAVIPSGDALHQGTQDYVGVSAIESAILIVSVEVFQSRTAPGGQIEGVDFSPTPYRMGRSLYSRVAGLLGAYVDVESLAQ
jgi:hypothetical protein